MADQNLVEALLDMVVPAAHDGVDGHCDCCDCDCDCSCDDGDLDPVPTYTQADRRRDAVRIAAAMNPAEIRALLADRSTLRLQRNALETARRSSRLADHESLELSARISSLAANESRARSRHVHLTLR